MSVINSVSKELRGDGQFDYFGKDESHDYVYNNSKIYKELFIIINNLELWDFIANGPGEECIWMECKDNRLNNIINELSKIGYNDSNLSISIALRVMEYIAKYGEKIFLKKIGICV